MGDAVAASAEDFYGQARRAFEQGAWTDTVRLAGQVLALEPLHAGAFELAAAARHSIDASDTAEGERRILSVLFCDLVESTSLVVDVGPERYRDIILAVQQVCARAVTEFEGRVAQYLGDGVLAYFSYPQAHEDDPRRAVHAALTMVEGVKPLAQQLRVGRPLAIRIGIDTGLVVVGAMGSGQWRTSDSIVGDAPNIAARIQGLAEPNSIVITANTWQLTEGFFDVESMGDIPLRNYPRPVTAFRVLGSSGAQHRFEAVTRRSPLVDRVDAVSQLTAMWSDVLDGNGRQVILVGEPGIGKSRLLELAANVVNASGRGRGIELQCSSLYSHTAFRPIGRAIRRILGLDPMGERIATDLFRRRLETAFGNQVADDDTVALLAYLVGLETPVDLLPEDLRRRTIEVLVKVFGRLAAVSKVLLLVDDVEYSDSSTLEFLCNLVGGEDNPFMLLMASRRRVPELLFTPTTVVLQPLPPADCEELVRSVLVDRPTSEIQDAVRRSDGVPLFAEELARAPLFTAADNQGYPMSLAMLLTARLDRLESNAKEVAAAMAVIGIDCDISLLAAVAVKPAVAVEAALRTLIDNQVVAAKGDHSVPTYQFRHALLREAAYDRQMMGRRAELHGRVADVLIRRVEVEGGNISPEVVAGHLTRADRLHAAVTWWKRAGDAAAAIAAHREAATHFVTALDLLTSCPDGPERDAAEFGVQLSLGLSTSSSQGYASPDALAAFERADQLGEAMSDSPAILPAVFGLWSFYIVRGDHERSWKLAQRCTLLAPQGDDDPVKQAVAAITGYQRFFLGDLRGALVDLELAARGGGESVLQVPQNPPIASRANLATTRWILGDLPGAWTDMRRAIAAADALTGRQAAFTRAFVLTFAAWLCQLADEAASAASYAQQAIAIASDHNFVTWQVAGTIHLAAARCALGEEEEALPILEGAITTWRFIGGAELMVPYFLSRLSLARLATGATDTALAILNEAIDLSSAKGERFFDAELFRLRSGAHTVARADETVIIGDLTSAAVIAREQTARTFELRALLDRCRLAPPGDGHAHFRRLSDLVATFDPAARLCELDESRALLTERWK
jgi:class 3 adenylate cyclase/tetratricopeptide (TPR) repeat protein